MKISDISYYLYESYKDAVNKFSQEESEETVNQYLDTFKQLSKKGIINGQEKDIGYWIQQGWYEFKEFVDSKSKEKTKSEVKKSKKKDAIIAYDTDDKMVVIPLTKDASCFYGKNTKWCTAATESENNFVEYFYINKIILIYVFMKETGEKYAVAYSQHKDEFEFFDEMDKRSSKNDFQDQTNLTVSKIKSWINKHQETIDNAMSINNLSEKDQMESVSENGHNIRSIENPSEAVQLEAVREDGYALRHIDKPSDSVIKQALESNGWAIQFIENPTEEMQKIAVIEDPSSIQYIKNPTEEIEILAIEESRSVIEYIKNPSEKAMEFYKQKWDHERTIEKLINW